MQMTKDEFNTLIEEAREWNRDYVMEDNGEWDREAAIDQSFIEAEALTGVLAEKRELEELKKIIESGKD